MRAFVVAASVAALPAAAVTYAGSSCTALPTRKPPVCSKIDEGVVIDELDYAAWGGVKLAFIDLDKTAFVTAQQGYCPNESDRSNKKDFMKKFKLNVQLWDLAKKLPGELRVDTFIATGNNPPMVQGKFMEPVSDVANRQIEKICTNEEDMDAQPAYAPGIYMNGAYVVDTNGKVIVESTLSDRVMECINGYLAKETTKMGILILNPSDIFVVNNKRSSWDTAMKSLNGFAGVYSMAVKPDLQSADGMQKIPNLVPVSKDNPKSGRDLSAALKRDDSLFEVSKNEAFPEASAGRPFRLAAVDSLPKNSYDIMIVYDASVPEADQLAAKPEVLTEMKLAKFREAQQEVAKLIKGFAGQGDDCAAILDMPPSDVTVTKAGAFSVSFDETKVNKPRALQYKLSIQDTLEFHITLKGGTKGDAMQKVVEEMNKGITANGGRPLTKENVMGAGDADNDKPLMTGTSDETVAEESKIVPGVRVRMPWAKEGQLELGSITNVQMSLERAYKNIFDAKVQMMTPAQKAEVQDPKFVHLRC